jgi:short-subunit dehydrogenase
MEGKKVVIPGLVNKILVNALRVFPRSMAIHAIKASQEKKS